MSKDTIISRITLLLAVCICGLMSCSDKDGIPSSQIHYTTVDNKVLALQIQENFGGAKIISNTYFAEDSVCIIEFSTDVTEIGEHAFSRSAYLTDIIIPESVTKIGRCAFWDCSSLTNVTIPSSVTEIGVCAFSDCSSLTSVIIPPSVTKIGGCAFSDCSSLMNIIIPLSVREIGNYAFSDCSSLTNVTIPSSVTEIGGCAFSDCSSLTSVIIPPSVTKIDDCAFSECASLTSICIPASVREIENNVFSDCSSLTSIKVESNNAIYDSREDCNAIIHTESNTLISGCQNTIIPESVTGIGVWAFSGCSSLTSICIPASVREIENNVFSDCSSLTSIKVESNNAIYDSREDCNAIIHTESNTLISGCQNTVIPESVTGIGVRAFSGCLSLTSISIPPSVTEIEALAFWGCSSLTTVKVSKDTHIADSAFEDCPNVRIERY